MYSSRLKVGLFLPEIVCKTCYPMTLKIKTVFVDSSKLPNWTASSHGQSLCFSCSLEKLKMLCVCVRVCACMGVDVFGFPNH